MGPAGAGLLGPPGFDGADGQDALPIPGSPGASGAGGLIGPPGMDGADGADAFPMGATTQRPVRIVVVIDGGGSAITTGVKGDVPDLPAMTITGWTLEGAEASGSIVIDIWKDTYANLPPTVADTLFGAGTEKPTITTAHKGQDLSLTTCTTSVAEGDCLRFNVDSITTFTRVTLTIRGIAT